MLSIHPYEYYDLIDGWHENGTSEEYNGHSFSTFFFKDDLDRSGGILACMIAHTLLMYIYSAGILELAKVDVSKPLW